MGQQAIPGALPGTSPDSSGAAVNIVDAVSTGFPGWTPGATLASPIKIQPALTERFSIIAWNITFNGLMILGDTPAGRLGKIIGGVFPGSLSTAGSQAPWANPMGDLPQDATTLQTLWDGATDPPFPQETTSTLARVPISVTAEPPTPIEISSGEQVSVGLWLTPSLITGFTTIKIAAFNGRYTVIYDDGNPPVAGWGGK